MLKAITLASIAAAFCINIYFCLIFLRGYWRHEDKKIAAGLLLNALFIAMLAAEHCLPVRGGYDSALCFGIARETFFSLKSTYKEISPVLAYTITDFLSSKSLHALLLQNMALSLLNALMLFSCLRRLRLGMAASFCGTAFFCINFNNLIAAASMASTQCNLFFFISAMAAALTPFYIQDIKKEYGKILIWLISSAVLIITSRAELAPVPLVIFAAGILSKKRISEIPALFAADRKYIAMAGLAVCLICSANVLSGEGFKNRFGAHSPYINAVYQTVSNNFAVMAGHKAYLWKFPPCYGIIWHSFHARGLRHSAAFCSAAGIQTGKKKGKKLPFLPLFSLLRRFFHSCTRQKTHIRCISCGRGFTFLCRCLSLFLSPLKAFSQK